jgi:hypothetical protein
MHELSILWFGMSDLPSARFVRRYNLARARKPVNCYLYPGEKDRSIFGIDMIAQDRGVLAQDRGVLAQDAASA